MKQGASCAKTELTAQPAKTVSTKTAPSAPLVQLTYAAPAPKTELAILAKMDSSYTNTEPFQPSTSASLASPTAKPVLTTPPAPSATPATTTPTNSA